MEMSTNEVWVVLGLWVTYIALGVFLAWGAARLSRRLPKWIGRLPPCLILAVFFAPSAVGMGHGAFYGPAWMALFQYFPLRLGVLPIAITACVLYAVATINAIVRGKVARK